MDEVDAGGAALMDDLDADTCLYLMVDSMDRLQLNVTPLGVSVLQDVVEVCMCVCVRERVCVYVCVCVHSLCCIAVNPFWE